MEEIDQDLIVEVVPIDIKKNIRKKTIENKAILADKTNLDPDQKAVRKNNYDLILYYFIFKLIILEFNFFNSI